MLLNFVVGALAALLGVLLVRLVHHRLGRADPPKSYDPRDHYSPPL